MHKTFLKIFILLLNCFVIFGLPFLKPDVGYRQGQTDDLELVTDTVDDDDRYPSSESQQDGFIPRSYYDNVPLWNSNFGGIVDETNSGDSDQDMIVKRPFENKFFGSRGKRFMSFMPSKYRGWYTVYQPLPRKRFNPNMYVSMRGKRLENTNYRSLANYLGLPDGKSLE